MSFFAYNVTLVLIVSFIPNEFIFGFATHLCAIPARFVVFLCGGEIMLPTTSRNKTVERLLLLFLSQICLLVFFSNSGWWRLVTSSFANAAENVQLGGVKFVQVIFCNGDHSPTGLWPGIPYDESIWSYGYDELTQYGLQQHTMLGLFLRTRYGVFLGGQPLNLSEVYVMSLDTNRHIAAAMATASALFRPPVEQQWYNVSGSEQITDALQIGRYWQPVPVHTIPADWDRRLQAAPCAAFDNLSQNLSDVEGAVLRPEDALVLEYLRRAVPEAQSLPLLDIWQIVESAKTLLDHGYNLSWTGRHNFTQNYLPLTDSIRTAYASGSEQRIRLHGGNLLKHALLAFYYKAKQMSNSTQHEYYIADSVLEHDVSNFFADSNVRTFGHRQHSRSDEGTKIQLPKLALYSVHDTTMISVLAALGLLDQNEVRPREAAAIIMELYSDRTMSVFYKAVDTRATQWNETAKLDSILHDDAKPLYLSCSDNRVSATCAVDDNWLHYLKAYLPKGINDVGWCRECNGADGCCNRCDGCPSVHIYEILVTIPWAVLLCALVVIGYVILFKMYRARRRPPLLSHGQKTATGHGPSSAENVNILSSASSANTDTTTATSAIYT